tara:strand:+ start:263 stop:529 length:267 start_codon:yes stop_codon:yes gene_type:complete
MEVVEEKSNISKVSDDIQEKIDLKTSLGSDINFAYRYIDSAKKNIKEIEKYLWRNCIHEWVHLDYEDNSRIKYNCKHCQLYRHSTMYN